MSNTPFGFPQGFPSAASPQAEAGAEKPKKRLRTSKNSATKSSAASESSQRVRGLLAILMGLLAAAFIGTSLTANTSKGKVFVLRAASPILPMTPIEASQLEAVQVPVEAVEAGALKAATAEDVLTAAKSGKNTVVVGRYALYPILANQQIRLRSMLSTEAQLGTALAADERLVTINVPLGRGVAGLVRTGDRVDIYSVSDSASVALAVNVEVVMAAPAEEVLRSSAAANPDSDPLTRLPSYPVPAMYVVRVPVSLVPSLVTADSSSTLYLAYRTPCVPTATVTCSTTPDVSAATSSLSTVPADK